MTDSLTGRTHNVTATVPEDENYSPLWTVNIYDNVDFYNVNDLTSALQATILVQGAANVNCPVVNFDEVSSVDERLIASNPVLLDQNYPNPFSYSTNIKFSVDRSEMISLSIFNLHGQQVADLIDQRLGPGEYSVQWEPRNEPEGIYFYTIRAGSYLTTKKMTLLR
ncbi:MAG: T9SS type A sorting domain-containing protein [Bacteroidales bacterium]